jgi:hypothetical protein
MRQVEYGSPEPGRPTNEIEEAMRPKILTQKNLIALWLKDHPTQNDQERREMELAWAVKYAAAFSELYVSQKEDGVAFRELVNGCNGSDECLAQIQTRLDDELGHH